jgi:hypothetical protein
MFQKEEQPSEDALPERKRARRASPAREGKNLRELATLRILPWSA